ncbi:hypothetical protein Ddye_029020 [Dipteronia dyeriana]|uniref:Uncharacterized protein n=1 Tax=Dipteronia dyeriana TaxID=168575 RepID=A0AAD9TED6_9ROSI|nr:hypothetical protein Ddye_029020 [Dipteronia dyeriana]
MELYPKAAIFRPTGANNNRQWPALIKDTPSNVLHLAALNQISPEVIECWRVIKGARQEKQDAMKGTLVERFKEDRHMLNMAGLANSSE